METVLYRALFVFHLRGAFVDLVLQCVDLTGLFLADVFQLTDLDLQVLEILLLLQARRLAKTTYGTL